ncbi:hypothetical protein GDO78_012333 [Eleutherodactylus coqui]|uniref:Uncharacterized protein n=1 Tax=Eleutherodactylus coqui TaxID=57060 RepID=A0A8J6EYT3_ELECQ|nr:hypothetical protein GDO78_012333 [Eleutherodactylus coqui]
MLPPDGRSTPGTGRTLTWSLSYAVTTEDWDLQPAQTFE